jgi:hypothetical protein
MSQTICKNGDPQVIDESKILSKTVRKVHSDESVEEDAGAADVFFSSSVQSTVNSGLSTSILIEDAEGGQCASLELTSCGFCLLEIDMFFMPFGPPVKIDPIHSQLLPK